MYNKKLHNKIASKVVSMSVLVSFMLTNTLYSAPIEYSKHTLRVPSLATLPSATNDIIREFSQTSIAAFRAEDKKGIEFGTSGFRGIIGKSFNELTVAIAAQATADYIIKSGLQDRTFAVCRDTREKGEVFTKITAVVLAANGIKVVFSPGYMPTPVIAHATVNGGFGGAINITASHNPREYSGFKFTPSHGGAAPADVTADIQNQANVYLNNPTESKTLDLLHRYEEVFQTALRDGDIKTIDPMGAYLDYLFTIELQGRRIFDLDLIKRSGPTVVADALYGTAARYFKAIFGDKRLGKLRNILHQEPRSDFGELEGPVPSEENFAALRKFVLENKGTLGIGADGDADREGIVDVNGRFMTANEMGALFYWYLHEIKGLKGGVAKTVATTNLLNALADHFGERSYETQVGYKNFVDIDAIVYVESSAHIGINKISWDDAFVCALLALQILADMDAIRAKTKKANIDNLTDLLNYIQGDLLGKYFSFSEVAVGAKKETKTLLLDMNQKTDKVSVRIQEEGLTDLLSDHALEIVGISTLPKKGVKIVFKDGSWICLRPSGTEPKVRIYAEATASNTDDARGRIPILNDIGSRILGISGTSKLSPAGVSGFDFSDLHINLGRMRDVKVEIDGDRAALTNDYATLTLESVLHKGRHYLRIGNATYLVRKKDIDLSEINPLGNHRLRIFFESYIRGYFDEHDKADFLIHLPIEKSEASLELFPVNPIHQPALVAPKVDSFIVDDIRTELISLHTRAGLLVKGYPREQLGIPIFEVMHEAAILALNGGWQDYYLVQDILNQLLELDEFISYREHIIRLSDYLLLSYIGCNWKKWEGIRSRIKAGKGKKSEPERDLTIFEKPVEATRLDVPQEELSEWGIVRVEALTDKDLAQLSTDSRDEAYRLGKEIIEQAQVVSVPFSGGSATTVKKVMGAQKMVHKALKVLVETAKGDVEKWISIIQARLGLIFGQNPSSKVALVTSVDGTVAGESDRSIRGLLDGQYPDQIGSGQIKVVMQRTGLVLNEDGEPLRFKDGRLATTAESHLWAFLAVFLDKDLVIDLLEGTAGILSVGNGDNILNFARAGMIGKILQARREGRPLSTVAISSASAGDKKGGFAAKVTYRNNRTGEERTAIEMREVSEFPTRDKSKTQFSAIDWVDRKDTGEYRTAEKEGWFIEDIFGNKKVAFNIAFYAVDMRLMIARMFGLNEQGPELITELQKIDKQLWADRVTELGEMVPSLVRPRKSIPNEDNSDSVTGLMAEQPVQDFIVNALALLAGKGLTKPEVEILLAERAKLFQPYKGSVQDVLDEDGKVVIDPTTGKTYSFYDLIANLGRYIGVVRELAAKGHYMVLGRDERVLEVLPPQGFREALKTRTGVDEALEEALDAVQKANTAKSSPAGDAEVAVGDILRRLKVEHMRGQMEALFGLERAKAEAVHPGNKFTEIGFDGKANRLGWTVPYIRDILGNPARLTDLLDDARNIGWRYKYIIFSGMGGSRLSIDTVVGIFGQPKELKIFTLGTTDPGVIADILAAITKDAGTLEEALKQTLVVPISKSGRTQETVSHKKYFEDLFIAHKINPVEHMLIITDPGSRMEQEAEKKHIPLRYLQLNSPLNIRTDIGGRFTAPGTSIFLLPLALIAPDLIKPLLEKAVEMNEIEYIKQDTFVKLGAYLYHMATQPIPKDKLTLFLPKQFTPLAPWMEQLFEESLGKDGKGITVIYGEDLDYEGIRRMSENDRVFLRIRIGHQPEPHDAEWKALSKIGYPTFDIEVQGLLDLGGLMLGLQRTVATIGYLWEINFVNQPAVEGYKRKTKEVMAQVAETSRSVGIPWESFSEFNDLTLYYQPLIEAGALNEEEIVQEVRRLGSNVKDAAAVYAAIIRILSRREGGFEVAEFAPWGEMSRSFRDMMQRARTKIFTQGLKMASKLAIHPDGNHSFQQNVEGGRDIFFSTHILGMRMRQPEIQGYEPELLKAQAIGTIKSVVENRRKAVLLATDGPLASAEQDLRNFFAAVERYLKKDSKEATTSTGRAKPSPAGMLDLENLSSLTPEVLQEAINLSGDEAVTDVHVASKFAAEIVKISAPGGTIVFNDEPLSEEQQRILKSILGKDTLSLRELERLTGSTIRLRSEFTSKDISGELIIISRERLDEYRDAKYLVYTDLTGLENSYLPIMPMIAIAKGLLGLKDESQQDLIGKLKEMCRTLCGIRLGDAAIKEYIDSEVLTLELPAPKVYDYKRLEQLQRQALAALIAA